MAMYGAQGGTAMLTHSSDDLWSELQQPAKPNGLGARFRLLLAALDSGWRIEAPVYLRPRWGSGGPRVYHFILYREGDPPRLLTVPEGAEVEAFVRAEGCLVRA
jgi:hypothetical protein